MITTKAKVRTDHRFTPGVSSTGIIHIPIELTGGLRIKYPVLFYTVCNTDDRDITASGAPAKGLIHTDSQPCSNLVFHPE
jgi:hypothetical protein